jgi:hypothetical protein
LRECFVVLCVFTPICGVPLGFSRCLCAIIHMATSMLCWVHALCCFVPLSAIKGGVQLCCTAAVDLQHSFWYHACVLRSVQLPPVPLVRVFSGWGIGTTDVHDHQWPGPILSSCLTLHCCTVFHSCAGAAGRPSLYHVVK